MTEEGDIKRLIMDYLKAQPMTYVRSIQIRGTPGRTSQSKGVSDIIGVWKGRFLAVEVKTKKGIVSVEQQEFLDSVKSCGGIAIVARSLGDVENVLNKEN